MKVVHFHRNPFKNAFSIERVFEDIRSSLPKENKNIVVRVHINQFTSKGIWRRIFDILKAAKNQGDINHITGDVHFLCYLMRKKKTILTVHDCVALERLQGISYWIFWLFWYWLPAKRCTVITVISESTKKELQKHLRINNYSIEVIPDCVSSEFQPFSKKFNTKKPCILQIGTKKNKNLERVTEALAGVTCNLIIIGQLSQTQLAVLKTNKIEFENHVAISRESLLVHYQQCDFVMFASLYEGFGLPILEAQAVGRPIITSNIYSMPEVAGNGAVFVDPYDVSEIHFAVKQLIEDRNHYQRMIELGYQNVKKFSAEAIAEKYMRLYEKIYNVTH